MGWHLAWVCRGWAGASLLSNFSAERVGAAREIIEEAGKSVRFMTPPSMGHEWVRNAVLSLSLTEAFVRPLYHWRTSRPHEYTHSSLNASDDQDARFTAGPAHGATAMNVRLGDETHLLDHLGGGFDLLWFSTLPVADAVLKELAVWRAQSWPIRVVAISREKTPVPGADLSLWDDLGRARTIYGVESESAAYPAYLLRPDQHVCGRWQDLNVPSLAKVLRQIAQELKP